MCKATDLRDAQTISLQLHGGDVTCFDVTKLLAGCDEVMWLVVSWRGVSYCGMSCHVMLFDVVVMLFDAMWFIVLCHVTWCKRCHVMCAHVMSCHLLCPAMGWNATSLRGHWLWGPVVWFEVVLWRCGVPKYCSVLLCTTPVLVCTTKYYPELLRNTSTTKYYSTTTPVLCTTPVLLQRTTPLLLSTTKYYSSTTLYCKETLMIDPPHTWNVIYNAQSNRTHPPTSPNIARATQNDSHDWSSHIWKVFYNVRSNRTHPPTSPNSAPATQNDFHDWSCSHMKRYLQRADTRSPRLLFALWRRILYWKLQHFALRLSTHISLDATPATKSRTPT